MSEYAKKLMSGLVPTESEWMDHLIEAHQISPSMTPYAFAPHKTKEGKNSYEILAESLTKPNLTVVDLACGDGHLIQYLLPKLGPNGCVHGIDMSAGELNVAKKNYKDAKIHFHETKAQSLPFKDNSVDLVLSHMAFMLMTPIEPVVAELARVIKPGGKFTAVIGGSKGSDGVWGELRKIFFGFVVNRFPRIREVKVGDSRLLSDEGLSQIFRNSFAIENARDFELQIDIAPEEIWNWVKDLYFVGMLPDEDKLKLEIELVAFAKTKDRLRFEDSMRIFTAVRNPNE